MLVIAVFWIAAVVPTPVHSAASAILCVAPTPLPTTAPCTNQTAYTRIQAAVKAAMSGDAIRVAGGVYRDSSDIYVVSIIDKSLTITGGYTTSNWQAPSSASITVIDGQDVRGGVQVYGESAVTLERLTITHGRNNTGGGIDSNIRSDYTLTLKDLLVTNNTASFSGGGVFSVSGTTVATRVQIVNNISNEDAGGFYGFHLIGENCTIADNTAARNGGGVSALYMDLSDTLVAGNTATTGDGGGIFAGSDGGATIALTRTQVLENSAGGNGGGIFMDNIASAQLSWTLLGNNTAQRGNAILIQPGFNTSQGVLQNVTISAATVTTGSAIQVGTFLPANPFLLTLHNTVINNYAVGLQRQSSTTINGDYNAFTNLTTPQIVDGQPAALPFATVVTTEPKFINPATNDFRLVEDSPLRDAGNPNLNYSGQRDLDGIAVPVGARVDIGGYEYISRANKAHLPLLSS